jgi:uncharacterized protein
MAPTPTAAELAGHCIDHLAAKDLDALRDLFDEDAGWEIAYPLEGVEGDDQIIRGQRRIAKFHTILLSGIDRVEFFDVDVTPVHDDLAFVEFRSRATTAKGQPYGNRYIARCDARNGRITHWREFFDPRPAELVRADHAENLAARSGT